MDRVSPSTSGCPLYLGPPPLSLALNMAYKYPTAFSIFLLQTLIICHPLLGCPSVSVITDGWFLALPRRLCRNVVNVGRAGSFPSPLLFKWFWAKADENSEGTVPAETKGSNGFYRVQTFAQNALAIDYGISSDKIRWP